MKLHFRYFFLFLVFVLLLSSFCLKFFGSNWNPISSDGFGYYAYLPSILHHSDVSGKVLMSDLPTEWEDEATGRMILQENGNYLNKYPIGVALLQSPGYITANIINNVFFGGEFDQYSGPYQVSVMISGFLAMCIGFYFLWKLLSKRFTEKVTYLTLLLIFLGTNILHYTTYDVSFSHVYSFGLFAYLLYLLDGFALDRKQIRYYVRLGIVFGLIVAVRQTNIITGLLFLIPLFKLYKNFGLLEIVKKYGTQLLAFALSVFLIVFIQMLYWKLVTDSWMTFAYQGEYFNFTHPEFFNVLFSFRKGLFVWTPLLLLSIPGIYLMFKKEEKFKYVIPLILLLQLYIVASWWAWSYGFSYGHRAFTEYLILFSMPIAYFIRYLFHRTRWLVYFMLFVFGLLVLVNLNFMQQYWRGELNPDGMTQETYINQISKVCVESIPGQGCTGR